MFSKSYDHSHPDPGCPAKVMLLGYLNLIRGSKFGYRKGSIFGCHFDPRLEEDSDSPFAVLFVVPLFDVNFKRFIYYIKMMLWSDPNSPPIDKIKTYYIRMSRKSQFCSRANFKSQYHSLKN